MKKSTIIEGISLLFTILFLYTGINKLIEYDVAKEQIGLTPLLEPIASEIVIILPIVEIITAILLFIPKTRRYGLWVSSALMFLFTGYVIYIVRYNDQLPCTCGGVLEQLSWPAHLVLNTVLLILSITSLLLLRPAPNHPYSDKKALAHN